MVQQKRKSAELNADLQHSTSNNQELESANQLNVAQQSPFAPVHPGRLLREYTLPGQNLDVKKLAAKLNVDIKTIDDIVNERAPITEEISLRIGNLLGGDPKLLLNFQRNYDMEVIDQPIRRSMDHAGVPISKKELEQQRVILMAFSFTKKGAEIGSIHAQKIMFLIDNEVDGDFGGPFFDHVQYKHGPNDNAINSILNNLINEKFMRINIPNNEWRKRKYILNGNGRSIGQKLVRVLPEKARQQMKNIVDWAMELRWTTLKREIYKKYPEMQLDKYPIVGPIT